MQSPGKQREPSGAIPHHWHTHSTRHHRCHSVLYMSVLATHGSQFVQQKGQSPAGRGSVEEGRGGRHAQADPKRARTPPLPPALARQRRWALLLPHPCLLLAQAPLQLSFRVFPRCAICPLQLPLKDCRCVRGRARQDNSAEKELDSQEEEREEMEKKEGGALSARSRRHRAPVTYKEEEDEVVVSDGEEASEQEGKCAAEDASSGEADADGGDEGEDDEGTQVVNGKRMSKYEAERLAKIERNKVCCPTTPCSFKPL